MMRTSHPFYKDENILIRSEKYLRIRWDMKNFWFKFFAYDLSSLKNQLPSSMSDYLRI